VKRHPKLQPLSDDHHRALVLARRTRRAAKASDSDSLARTWRDAQATFAAELEPHFRAEETWLFPLLDEGGLRTLFDRARADHKRLRELIRSAADPVTAREFADLLEAHVRFEERELFPRVEIALAAYDDAAIRGLCHEGAREAAVSALHAAGSAQARLDQDLRVPLRRGE
jgi:hemerythrin-like domain-containing protein